MRLRHEPAQFAHRIEGKRTPDCARKRAYDLPVLTRFARREYRSATALDPPLGAYVGGVLLGVGSPREHHIRAPGTAGAMVSLVNHKGTAEIAGVDLVGAEQVEQLDIARFAA